MKQYDNIEEFRDDLLEYFNLEKKYIEEDIEAAKELSLEQMIEEGLLIESCKVASEDKDGYVMDVSENNTKLRTGDKAIFYDGANKFTVQILENGANQVKLVSNVPLKAETSYQLIVDQCVMLDPYIALAENIEDGMAGGSWYKILLGLRSPKANGSKSISDTILTGKRDYLN
ncbi:MAG: hypothetical protein HUJ98_09435, partial [Bacteroidaceae bacterium]|nr:hypothetical protein [Bacteroidaceae bacterium]